MHSKKNRKTAGNILFFMVLLFFVFSVDARSWVLKQLIAVGLFNVKIEEDAQVGHPLQNDLSFSFSDANGKEMTTADLKGKVVFLNFWATWCPPCRAEMPSLNELYNTLKDDDRIFFLFISEDEDTVKARNYLQKHGFDIPFITRSGRIPPGIFSGTLPTTIVLNKEGRIVLKHEGIANYNTSEFRQQLKNLF